MNHVLDHTKSAVTETVGAAGILAGLLVAVAVGVAGLSLVLNLAKFVLS